MTWLAFGPPAGGGQFQGLNGLVGAVFAALPYVVGILVGIGALILIGRSLLYICPPNEVMIFSGRRHRLPDGTVRGFRVVLGGRSFRVPVFERVSRMSLSTLEVGITIKGAYSKGGIPLNVEAMANVKISSSPLIIGNAIERFLGRDRNEIRRVAKETLEGHLRGVLATLTPEEVNEDRLKFAESLSHESEEDLSKLGLHVDTLKIQHVSDEVHFLDSIGRVVIASVIKDAEIAESDAKREAEQAEAENEARAKVALAQVEAKVLKMRNELRTIRANVDAEVRAEEERTAAAAREARAIAEQELQKVRAELESVRQVVETVLPAEADRVASEFVARGSAASIRERGVAVSMALDELNSAWRSAGPAALQIALIEDLEKLMGAAAQGVSKIKVGGVHLIDNGDGRTLANYVAAYPAMLAEVFKAVHQTTGIDVLQALSGDVAVRKDQTEVSA